MGLSGESAWWPRKINLLPEKEQNNYGFRDTSTRYLIKRIKKSCGIGT